MRSRSLTLSLLLGAALAAAPALRQEAAAPRVEVLFVLDTTGSMGGLIEGAKLKIWSIAARILQGRPSPRVRIGLIGYRDKGDAYVTRFTDLSSDLDAVYGQLQTFAAQGGGDAPESVNQALAEAVARPSWSADPGVLKLVFLVGDAPPHMDYQDDVKYPVTLRRAQALGLVVNTVQCGASDETERYWREIAGLGQGSYLRTGQTGDVQVIATPYDAELARLNGDLGGTFVAYGREPERAAARKKVEAAAAIAVCAPAVAADRMVVTGAAGKVVTGGGDLVEDVAAGRADAGRLEEAKLPPELRKLAPAERKAVVERKLADRTRLQARIQELTRRREAYLAKATAERAKSGQAEGFDAQVLEVLRAKAKAKGIAY